MYAWKFFLAYTVEMALPCWPCRKTEPATLTRFQSECSTVSPEKVMFRAWSVVEVPATLMRVDTLFGAKTCADVMSSEGDL